MAALSVGTTGCSSGDGVNEGGKLDLPSKRNSNLHIYSSGQNLHHALDALPRGGKSLDEICKTPSSNKVWRGFCGSNGNSRTVINSLRQLFSVVGVTSEDLTSCTTNSVSLVKNGGSVLNPRCIRFSSRGNDADFVAVGFQRDDLTLVELVARDPVTRKLHFYLGDFELPCEKTEQGCQPGAFFVEASESNWASFSLYEDKVLKNTAMDCTTCHQPGGVNTSKRLIMAEAEFPWTHWFDKETTCGKSLFADFEKAHAGETFYAGTSLAKLKQSEAVALEEAVFNNGFKGRSHGNNFFESLQISFEVGQTNGQPETNANQSFSDTWEEEFNRRNAMLGLDVFGGVSMPYRDCKQSDPNKLDFYSNKLSQYIKGSIDLSEVPELHHVNLSDETALRERGMLVGRGTTGKALLKRACIACHNNNLDQSITRANFNAQDLTKNSAEDFDTAIYRLRMVKGDLQLMPPKNYIDLTEEEVLDLISYLTEAKRSLASE